MQCVFLVAPSSPSATWAGRRGDQEPLVTDVVTDVVTGAIKAEEGAVFSKGWSAGDVRVRGMS